MALIEVREAGLYCPRGRFHIDPWKPVPHALVTHGHGDHARPGNEHVVAANPGLRILEKRLPDAQLRGVDYGEELTFRDVKVSFHPAGHVLGSAQIRVEHEGEVWVVTGDYKRAPDPTCAPFEPVKCDVLITEATFALPIYRWRDPQLVARDIAQWWRDNAEADRASLLYAYILGKSQRILAELARIDDLPERVVYTHGATEKMVAIYREAGVRMLDTELVADEPKGTKWKGRLVLAPPSVRRSPWVRKFGKHEDRVCLGVDAGPWDASRSRAESGVRALRSRGLARTLAHRRGERGAPSALHPWVRGPARPPSSRTRGGCCGARDSVRRRGRSRDVKRFAQLYLRLDRTTSTNAKVDAMAKYFTDAPAEDATWAVFFLSGERMKRLLGWKKLAIWAREASGLSDWLFDACLSTVGDLAETISLLIQRSETGDELALHRWVGRIASLADDEDVEQRKKVVRWWRELEQGERFLLNKLLNGALRVGVSRTLVVKALSKASGVERAVLQHRLSGSWTPSAEFHRSLLSEKGVADDVSRPYPFFLASPLQEEPATLGKRVEWLAEWKWDGIRAQLIRRNGQTFLWSRGEELITERFPEITDAAAKLPDGTVLDGEALCWDHDADKPLSFGIMQKRIGRKKLGPKILREAPAFFMSYDLLEQGGKDLRELPQRERRQRMEKVVAGLDRKVFRCSPLVTAKTWKALANAREESREGRVEGLMLKRADAKYQTGRKKGDWWKWKIDPLTLDCVMIYAQAGHGRRAGLFTDYTFAVWSHEDAQGTRKLLPIARAYSGLDDEEVRELDKWIRRHTLEKFGPARAVEPVHVFEIAFEGIRESKRHKSGVAVRFPRILRWRREKKIREANTMERVQELLKLVE